MLFLAHLMISKLYNTRYVEFRIAGKSGCLPKTTPTPTQTRK